MLTRTARVTSTKIASRGMASSAMPQVPLNQEFPGLPETHPEAAPADKVTTGTASSGLRYVAENNGSLSTIAMHIPAGSRYEVSHAEAGLSQVMSELSFRSTEYRSDIRLYRDIESIGGRINTHSDREGVTMSISVLPNLVSEAAEILSESFLRPRFAQWDIDLMKNKVISENNDATHADALLDGIHEAAFYDNTPLGRARFDVDYSVKTFTEEDCQMYHDAHYNAANAVLVGTGVDAGVVADIANESFAEIAGGEVISAPAAKYVGAESRQNTHEGQTYVALAFQGEGAGKQSSSVAAVLESVLSARLAKKESDNCNKYGTYASEPLTQGFSLQYKDTGLFGASGVCAADEADALTASLAEELNRLASSPVTDEELVAAKANAGTTLALQMENNNERVAALGVGVVQGNVETVADQLNAIQAVNADQVKSTAAKYMKSPVSVASVGGLHTMPHYAQVAALFN